MSPGGVSNAGDANGAGLELPPIVALATKTLYPAILDLIPDPLRGSALDVPAGRGAFARELVIRGAEEVHCLDINEAAFQLRHPRVKFQAHDVMRPLPYPDNRFDSVFSIEGLEHFENPWTFVRELCRVLKPGGRFVITTPNTFSVDARIKYLLSGYFPRFRPLMQSPAEVMSQDVDDAHVSPIYFWQLNFFLMQSGAVVETLSADARLYKPQWPKRVLERLLASAIRRNIRKRGFPDPGVTSEDVLFGDCIIVCGRKLS